MAATSGNELDHHDSTEGAAAAELATVMQRASVRLAALRDGADTASAAEQF